MAGMGEAAKEAPRGLLPRTVGQVVTFVLLLGALSVTLLAVVSPHLSVPAGMPELTPHDLPLVVGLFIVLAAVGELAYVRIRHGSTNEDLTFLEAVLAACVLTLSPIIAMAAVLAGLLLASLLVRRDRPKTLFNLGSYATSTAAMIILYRLLNGGHGIFSWPSTVSLVAATLVFGTINLLLISLIFRAAAGVTPRDFLRDEWKLTMFMAVGGVGLGMLTLALIRTELYPLLPAAFLPALALWYAYGAAAQHAEARERNRWLVSLGGALAEHGQGASILTQAAESVRQVVGAPEMALLLPAQPDSRPAAHERRILSSLSTDPGPRALAPEELPRGWRTGVVTRLDVGAPEPGALLLGSTARYRHSRITGRTRGWSLEEADAPVLGALVAAIGSAMRAGAAFHALTEETAKLTAVVDNTSDGIAMVDETGRVRLWSQTMARMTGVDGAELTDLHDLTQAPEIVRTLIRASWSAEEESDASPDGVQAPVRVHLTRADGEELDVSVATVRVRESAATTTADTASWVSILTVHDETRERRVERMKTDFVATISHELRTPITPIKGYAHLLASRGDRIPAEKRQAALEMISDRADHLTRLVDDLLLASRVSEGARLAVVMGEEDLHDVIRQAVASFPAMATRIRVDLPERPVRIQCDRVRAVQCLSNLIGNAEKYTPADTPLDIRAEITPMQVHIHVRDHGAGIPAHEQDKVFERFYRMEDPFTMRTGGAGLGLHIARELAIAMGGGLTLHTPPTGTGAEFVLHLLTAEAPRVGGPQGASRPADPQAAVRADTPGALRGGRTTTTGPTGDTMGPSPDQPLAALSVLPATKER